VSADDPSLSLEHAEILADRYLGNREPLSEIGDAHPALFLNAAGDVLLALTREHFR